MQGWPCVCEGVDKAGDGSEEEDEDEGKEEEKGEEEGCNYSG